SQKLWVVIAGGLLGILAIRLIVAQVLVVIDRYPALIDGAYVIIAWVGLKLLVEYFHAIYMVPFAISQPVGVGVVVLLFIASFFYARVRRGASREPESRESEGEEAERLLLG